MPFKVSYYGTPSQTNTVVKNEKMQLEIMYFWCMWLCVRECSFSRDARASVCGYWCLTSYSTIFDGRCLGAIHHVTAISNSLTCSMFKVNEYNFRGSYSVDFIFPLFSVVVNSKSKEFAPPGANSFF